MIESVWRTSRNVKRSKSGDMCLRWTAAGMLEAERQFRQDHWRRYLARLTIAVERDVAAQRAANTSATLTATAAPEVAATTV